jgi:hypothetical protein
MSSACVTIAGTPLMACSTARRFAANGSLAIIEVDVFGRHLHHFDGDGPQLYW